MIQKSFDTSQNVIEKRKKEEKIDKFKKKSKENFNEN